MITGIIEVPEYLQFQICVFGSSFNDQFSATIDGRVRNGPTIMTVLVRPSDRRRAVALAACVLAAACRPDAVSPDDLLTAGDVQGTYSLCELRFTPSHRALPAADVLNAVMIADPPAPLPPPSITLSGVAPEFDLVYTRRRDGAAQRLDGDVEFGTGSVFLYLNSRAPTLVPFETLLPPGHLDLVFHAAAGRMTAGGEVSAYYVRRRDYAAAAGIPEEGLQERIVGHISAALARDGCG